MERDVLLMILESTLKYEVQPEECVISWKYNRSIQKIDSYITMYK